MTTHTSKQRTLGFVAMGLMFLATWAAYAWMGKELSTNITMIGAGFIIAFRAMLFRWPAMDNAYYVSMRKQGLMIPKYRMFCIVITIPCLIGMMIAGWWICMFASLIWLANFEYDFRRVQADHSVNAAV